jgi:hypothetical protein
MELFQHVSFHPDAQESDELNALQERSQGTIFVENLQIQKSLIGFQLNRYMILVGVHRFRGLLWPGPCFPENRDLRIGENFI